MVQCPHCARVVVEGRWVRTALPPGSADRESSCPACLRHVLDQVSARLHVLRAVEETRSQPTGVPEAA